MKPVLFLLHPDFIDAKLSDHQKYYCPHCAMVEGVLNYYPNLREQLDIRYVNFPRPRHEIIAIVGEQNQGCPLLIVDEESPYTKDFSTLNKLKFTNDKMIIASYLAAKFGIALAHP